MEAGRAGLSGKGILKVFSPADKYAETFIATYQQDAFAFAVTILHLFDEKGVFGPKISAACPQDAKTLSKKKKNAYTDKNMVINDNENIIVFLKYLQDRLFLHTEELYISNIIESLLGIYKAIVKDDYKFFQTSLEIDRMKEANKKIQEAVGKPLISPGRNNLIVL